MHHEPPKPDEKSPNTNYKKGGSLHPPPPPPPSLPTASLVLQSLTPYPRKQVVAERWDTGGSACVGEGCLLACDWRARKLRLQVVNVFHSAQVKLRLQVVNVFHSAQVMYLVGGVGGSDWSDEKDGCVAVVRLQIYPLLVWLRYEACCCYCANPPVYLSWGRLSRGSNSPIS